MAFAYVVLLLLTIFEIVVAQEQHLHQLKQISPGSSLSPSKQPSSWNSSSGGFQFGFYQRDAGFSVGIWLVTSPNITIVWTANRDEPPVSPNATLTLTKNGKLILRTEQGQDKIIANTLAAASFASMLDSGNFVLYNYRSDVIWSSFNFPTDTILGGQILSAKNELFSRVSETNSSIGRFRLNMQDDGNLVLYPINTIDEYTEAYWASGTNSPEQQHLYLNNTGVLQIRNSSKSIIRILNPDSSSDISSMSTIRNSDSSSDNSSIIYRLTLDKDGVLRLYSHYFVRSTPDREGAYNTSVQWKVPNEICLVKSFCGLNSYCTLDDDQHKCNCLPGTYSLDHNPMSSGCERYFVDERCGVTDISAEYNMTSMEKMTWDDYPYFQASMLEEECRKSCLEDCECDAVMYDSGYCKKQKLPLKTARRYQGESSLSTAYFKTGIRNITTNITTNGDYDANLVARVTSKKAIIMILVMTLGFTTCSCVFVAFSGILFFKFRVLKYKWLLEIESFGLTDELTLRSFSYNELKKATNGFKEELGKGSFGAVYKGTIYKGEKLVAVKRLEKMVTDGEREFRTEMHVIGRTHHKNLVQLLGYCAEESKRLLVYEYMSNGSLADILFCSQERSLDWNERVRIALDVARGILYLHDECEAPIVHCDIKPQNILIDEFWTAKISDFGLAKLLMPDQTRTFTMVRGTRGYMAPEWYKNTPISVKADVYSYGVVLLEIVCCRRNVEINPSKPEEIFLTNWVYKCFINGELNKLVHGQEVDKNALENLVKVGLWCVQDESALRPSMKSVVMMLEGIIDIKIPPCPTNIPG